LKRPITALALAVVLASCASTHADTVGLKYNKGPIEGESFDEVVEPGSGQQFVWNDTIVELPINQRDYTACAAVRDKDKEGCDAGPIRVAARGGAELDISLGVTFELNTGKADVLRQFYEEVCKKFDCTSDEGWDEMLRVNFRGPIEQAVQQQVRGFTVNELFAGVPAEGATDDEAAVSTLDKVQTALATDLKENINSFVGGDFFCGPAYERSEPDKCPDFVFQITDVSPVDKNVREAFSQNVASQQDVVTAKNKAEAQLAEAIGESEAARVLAEVAGIPGYVEYLRVLAAQACANNPKCTLVISDGSANVNVNTGGTP
jgi:hypothetical protein